jgi:hypothetical protein
MAFATNGPRVVQRLRTRPAPAQPDFADYGTAFGLELSLQPEAGDEQTAAVRRPGWWRRLQAHRAPPLR